jgi:phosphate transport system substrate-binding protein
MRGFQTMILRALILVGGSGFSLCFAEPEKLVIMGSDTLGSKLVLQLKEAYREAGNRTNFEISADGSSQAFANLLAGEADIGMSSRDARDEEAEKFKEKGKSLVEHTAGWDMIAVVVNERRAVRKLDLEEIEGIFSGDISDWSELGGKPGKIAVYTRNAASGTHRIFRKLAMSSRDYSGEARKLAGNEQIANEVAANENGIGYVGLAFAKKKGLRAVRIDGISPRPRNREKYPLARRLYFYTAGEPKGDAKRFLDWSLQSEEAREIVAKVGFIPAD